MISAIISFFKNIGNIVTILRLIYDLIQKFQEMKRAKKEARDHEKQQKRNEAVDQLQNASSEAEFDRAQDSIVRNKP